MKHGTAAQGRARAQGAELEGQEPPAPSTPRAGGTRQHISRCSAAPVPSPGSLHRSHLCPCSAAPVHCPQAVSSGQREKVLLLKCLGFTSIFVEQFSTFESPSLGYISLLQLFFLVFSLFFYHYLTFLLFLSPLCLDLNPSSFS